jgi:hypothetical protein
MNLAYAGMTKRKRLRHLPNEATHVPHTPAVDMLPDVIEVWFAYMWAPAEDGCGGPAVTDPAMLYVGLPRHDGGNATQFSVSLEAAVDDLIDMGPDDDSVIPAVAARLRELAEKLEIEAGKARKK